MDYIAKYAKILIGLALVFGFIGGSWNSNHQDLINTINQKIDSSTYGLSTEIQGARSDITAVKNDVSDISAKVNNIDEKTTDLNAIFENNQRTAFQTALFSVVVASVISVVGALLLTIPLSMTFKLFQMDNVVKIEGRIALLLVGFFSGAILTVLLLGIVKLF